MKQIVASQMCLESSPDCICNTFDGEDPDKVGYPPYWKDGERGCMCVVEDTELDKTIEKIIEEVISQDILVIEYEHEEIDCLRAILKRNLL